MPARKPDTDLRLGLWRIRILHLASLEPVWGGKLVKLVASWGEAVPSSVVHDALAFMAMKGWLVRVAQPAPSVVRAFSISPAGRHRLDQLRRQIGDLHAELEGTGMPGATAPVAEQLEALVRRTSEERDRMRAALAAMRDVVTQALNGA